MTQASIPHTFYLSLLEFLLNSKHHIMALSTNYGLTPMQAMTLLLTRTDEPRPMNSFCRMFNCDASNVTGIIDGLEEKGLVSRQENPADRRVKQIQLEPAGQKLQAELVRELSRDDQFLLAPLSHQEIQQFVHIIQKLAHASETVTT